MRPGVAAPLHAVLLPRHQHQVLPQHLRTPAAPALTITPLQPSSSSGDTRDSVEACGLPCRSVSSCSRRIVHAKWGGGGGGGAWPAM